MEKKVYFIFHLLTVIHMHYFKIQIIPVNGTLIFAMSLFEKCLDSTLASVCVCL